MCCITKAKKKLQTLEPIEETDGSEWSSLSKQRMWSYAYVVSHRKEKQAFSICPSNHGFVSIRKSMSLCPCCPQVCQQESLCSCKHVDTRGAPQCSRDTGHNNRKRGPSRDRELWAANLYCRDMDRCRISVWDSQNEWCCTFSGTHGV